MDDNTNELSREEIFREVKETIEKTAEEYSFSMNELDTDKYIEKIKKLDYVEDAYRDPNDEKFIHIICNKPISSIYFDLVVPKEEGEQQDG